MTKPRTKKPAPAALLANNWLNQMKDMGTVQKEDIPMLMPSFQSLAHFLTKLPSMIVTISEDDDESEGLPGYIRSIERSFPAAVTPENLNNVAKASVKVYLETVHSSDKLPTYLLSTIVGVGFTEFRLEQDLEENDFGNSVIALNPHYSTYNEAEIAVEEMWGKLGGDVTDHIESINQALKVLEAHGSYLQAQHKMTKILRVLRPSQRVHLLEQTSVLMYPGVYELKILLKKGEEEKTVYTVATGALTEADLFDYPLYETSPRLGITQQPITL